MKSILRSFGTLPKNAKYKYSNLECGSLFVVLQKECILAVSQLAQHI